MTTLYFEAELEDDLRKIGFSKDGKFRKPQIMLGLLVAEHGYPIGYSIFEGNKFEGHTLIPVLQEMQQRFDLQKPVVIADAAMLTERNLGVLAAHDYQFIIGGRIKNESSDIQATILRKSKGMKDGDSFAIKKSNGHRLIITYSDKRAKKDAHNRERGLRRLQQRLKSGKLTKENINNRGYNKFLTIEGDVSVQIDEQKVNDDQRWDGLKGYVTTTALRRKTVVANYGQLWRIERAFRISKHDLRIRPVYHYKKERIEAHICIAFAAYTIWKELERLLQKADVEMTPTRAAELTRNMYAIEFQLPDAKNSETHILRMDTEQEILWKAIHLP
jgi:transposase